VGLVNVTVLLPSVGIYRCHAVHGIGAFSHAGDIAFTVKIDLYRFTAVGACRINRKS